MEDTILDLSKYRMNKAQDDLETSEIMFKNKIEVEYSKMLTTAFKIRSDSDYKDFYIISRQDAELQLENARKFVKRIQDFLIQLKHSGKDF